MNTKIPKYFFQEQVFFLFRFLDTGFLYLLDYSDDITNPKMLYWWNVIQKLI